MKQQVLKALANPPRIFYVPYYLAILNFFINFMIYMVIFVVTIIIDFTAVPNPLIFLIPVIIIHFILIGFTKHEPQLAKIIGAKIKLIKHKIPGQLIP